MKKIILIILICNGCIFDQSIKSQYFDLQNKPSPSDNILILPSCVIKEVKTGSDALESMFDTYMFSLLKDKGYNVQASESIFSILKEKNLIFNDFKKIEFKDLDQKTLSEIASKLNVKFYLRLTVFSHIKEDFMTESNYFLSLKVYTLEGKESLVLSTHYQGDEPIGSSKILKLVENLISTLIKGK